MSHAQEPKLRYAPFDKMIKATGEMRATIERRTDSVPIVTPYLVTTNEVYRGTGGDFVQVLATMSIGELVPRFDIVFELKGRNAASGTYEFPSDDVLSLFCEEVRSDSVITYQTRTGRIEFLNHQPIERVSGSLHFQTAKRDGVFYNIIEAHFDIEGTN